MLRFIYMYNGLISIYRGYARARIEQHQQACERRVGSLPRVQSGVNFITQVSGREKLTFTCNILSRYIFLRDRLVFKRNSSRIERHIVESSSSLKK